MATRTAATVEDVLCLGAQGERYELVDGELVPMSPTGMEHARIEAFVTWVLNTYVLPRQVGEVFSGKGLFRLDLNAGIARAPDAAFIRQDRLLGRNLVGAFDGAPDLAVEIVSPNDAAKDVQRKVEEWLGHGTIAVLLMYPETRSIVVWRRGQAVSAHDGDEVDLSDALPGFRSRAEDLFPPPRPEPGPMADQDSEGGS
jgi:Uma2 family endonuclease